MKASPALWNLRNSAEYLGFTPRELRALALAGEIPVSVRNRGTYLKLEFLRSDLDDWLLKVRIGPRVA